MTNIILAGVGGQGTVLAAKVLANAAAGNGWKVRTAETIGMSQRGGSVVSHVRIADDGTPVHSSLIMRGRADIIIAFEPGEAARVLPYLAKSGTLITATTPIEPVSSSLSGIDYDTEAIIDSIEKTIGRAVVRVDDSAIIDALGGSKRMLNTIMLAKAVQSGALPFDVEKLKAAIASSVRPAFVDANLEAIEVAIRQDNNW